MIFTTFYEKKLLTFSFLTHVFLEQLKNVFPDFSGKYKKQLFNRKILFCWLKFLLENFE